MLKGNAVIGQSGGPTCVINESLVGAVLEARRHTQIGRLYGSLHGIQGILDQCFIDLSSVGDATLEAIARTPSAGLGSVRKKPTREDCERIVEIFRAHDIRFFFYIGGNDSAETANIIAEITRDGGDDFCVAHIPKTIDNDLRVTDHCPGYGSAARFVALALMGDNLDNRALNGVKIDVIMGRHAGFLTAASALGRRRDDDGPHLIYVPEVPFQVDSFCADVDAALTKHRRCVVAVSEGITGESGEPVVTTGEKDDHGNVQLSGTGALGDFLANTIREKLKVKRVRADTFGYLQRCFPSVVSRVDAAEAREVGARAVRTLVAGDTRGGSIAIIRRTEGGRYAVDYQVTALANVARETRSLDAKYIAPSRNDVTREFVDYALPLVDALPEMGRFEVSSTIPKKSV